MNKYKKLINNSIVLTIGNFGSKLINFLMVPLYTNLLSTTEYGLVDVIITTRSLLVPLITLELGQAALRFGIDSKSDEEKNVIFSNISIHGLIASVLLLLLTPILLKIDLFGESTLYFILLLILSLFNSMYSQYIRGIGLVRQFAINGILMTIATVVSNIILLVVFELGIQGYLISLLIATFVSNVYLFFAQNKVNKIKKLTVKGSTFKRMLQFSGPVVPNSAMWWIINGSSRYFVLYFVGASANGLYAIASKIPSIISMVTGIFSQAWQLSSFEEYESDDKDEFYTEIFNIYYVFLFLAGSVIIAFLKPLLTVFIDSSFYESWKIVPFLLISVIYQSFSTFLGTNYTAAKETKGTFSTSIYAGIISLVSSFILVPFLGAMGAGLSSALSFIGMFVIRLKDTRKFVKINISMWHFLISNLIIVTQSLILFLFEGVPLLTIQIILLLILLLINHVLIKKISKRLILTLKKFLKNKKK